MAILKNVKGCVGGTNDERTLHDRLDLFFSLFFHIFLEPHGIEIISHLDSSLLQILTTLELCGVNADTLVQVAIGDLWDIGFLRAKPCGLDKLLGGDGPISCWSLDVDSPLLQLSVVLGGQDFSRVDAVELEGLDIFVNLVAQLVLGEQMWGMKVLVVGCRVSNVSARSSDVIECM